jgi:hypothetical protein
MVNRPWRGTDNVTPLRQSRHCVKSEQQFRVASVYRKQYTDFGAESITPSPLVHRFLMQHICYSVTVDTLICFVKNLRLKHSFCKL